jgi:hypothetical protein
MIQSIIFNKHYWTIEDAVAWLLARKIKVLKYHDTPNFVRFRLLHPVFNNYYTKELGGKNRGIQLIIAS